MPSIADYSLGGVGFGIEGDVTIDLAIIDVLLYSSFARAVREDNELVAVGPVEIAQSGNDVAPDQIGAMHDWDLEHPAYPPLQDPLVLIAVAVKPIRIDLRKEIGIISVRVGYPQQRCDDRQLQRHKLPQCGRKDEVIHVTDKIKIASTLGWLRKAYVSYIAQYAEPGRVPFVLTECFHRLFNRRSIELNGCVKRANPINPFAEDFLATIRVVVRPHVQDDRRFRIVEPLDTAKKQRERLLLLLSENGDQHTWVGIETRLQIMGRPKRVLGYGVVKRRQMRLGPGALPASS